MKPWNQAAQDGVVTGSVSSVASNIALALCGQREAGAPLAPINAVSHWLYGDSAAEHDEPSLRHTLTGYTIHHAASTVWAILYERWFGEDAERRDVARALAGGAFVSGMACFVDYKMTPHRLQPGYEMRLSKRSLFVVYATLAAAFAIRGLLSGPAPR